MASCDANRHTWVEPRVLLQRLCNVVVAQEMSNVFFSKLLEVVCSWGFFWLSLFVCFLFVFGLFGGFCLVGFGFFL